MKQHKYFQRRLKSLARRLYSDFSVDTVTGCWNSNILTRTPEGYRVLGSEIENKGQHHIYAHRGSFLVAYGDLPAGKQICHTCDNPACINPAHLWAGTASENMQDCVSKGRMSAKRNGIRDSIDIDALIKHKSSIPRGQITKWMEQMAADHGIGCRTLYQYIEDHLS